MSASRYNAEHSNTWAVVLVFGIIAGLYFTRAILVPLAFALTLTFLLTPAVILLEKLRIGRVLSVMLTVLASMAAAGCIAWVIANQLVDVANQLPRYRQNIHVKIQALRSPGKGPLAQAAQSVKEIGQELSRSDAPATPQAASQTPKQRNAPRLPGPPVPVQVVPNRTNGLTDLRDLATPLLAPLGITGIVIIFTVFMLIKREDLRNRLLRLVGLGQLNIMTQALDDAAQRVSRYLLMQFLVNASFGALFGAGLYFVGVPNPALWGVLAGLLRIVPYVGTMVAAALPIMLSLAVFDAWLPPLLVFVLFASLELIIGNFVEPWLYGAHTGISSLALLVSTVFWTVLWGPAGLILSTPLTVCVVVLGRYFPQLSFLHILLGDDPVLEAEAHLYQRLLARDQPEARSIVDTFLREKSLIELYDSVLIPALSLAEQDRHNGLIDATHEEFLFLSVNEMIAEFSESPQALIDSQGASGDAKSAPAAAPYDGRILFVPAHDQADEVTAAMLAQILEQEGRVALSCPLGASPLEILTLLQPDQEDIICISALPPYAFAPTRMLCKQIRGRYPKVKLVVGVWGFKGDTEKAKARFERAEPDRLITSLAQAVVQIEALARANSSPPLQLQGDQTPLNSHIS
jgi:predicted PurR-regulated permease PerM